MMLGIAARSSMAIPIGARRKFAQILRPAKALRLAQREHLMDLAWRLQLTSAILLAPGRKPH